MLVNKIKIVALSFVFVSFVFADMETKSLDLASDYVYIVKDSKEPKLKKGHGSLSDFFPYPKSLLVRAYKDLQLQKTIELKLELIVS